MNTPLEETIEFLEKELKHQQNQRYLSFSSTNITILIELMS